MIVTFNKYFFIKFLDNSNLYTMKGKNFILYLTLFFTFFAITLFLYLYQNQWFDLFIAGGFKALYSKD